MPWTADTIPPELAAILDERAGQEHSPGGAVRSCLAEILNRYDELRTLTVLIEFPATVTPAEVERFKAAWVEHRGGPVEYKLAGSGDD